MKICLINNLYKPYNRGGAEIYLEKLNKGFKNKGHNVFVVSLKPGLFGKETGDDYYINSSFYFLDKIPKYLRLFWHLFNVFNFIKYFQVRNILRDEKPDLVITNNLLGFGFLLPVLISKLKIKHIHILHDIQLLHPSGLMFFGKENIINSFFAKIYQKINKYLFSKVKYVVSPSNWLLDIHKGKGFFAKAISKRIFNPIDDFSIKKNFHKRSANNFLYVGQIEKHKGVVLLIQSMSKIIKNNKNIKLKIVGDGSLRDELESDYGDHIQFLGKLNSDKVHSEMLNADCLLVSSLCYENSPTVIYEAATMNLNFIYSGLGGASEIGSYFNGLPFDLSKKDALSESIEKCINNIPKENILNKKVLKLSTSEYIKKILGLL